MTDVEHCRRRLTGDSLTSVAAALGLSVTALQTAAMFEDVRAKYPELAELLDQVRRCRCKCGEVLRGA